MSCFIFLYCWEAMMSSDGTWQDFNIQLWLKVFPKVAILRNTALVSMGEHSIFLTTEFCMFLLIHVYFYIKNYVASSHLY